MDAINLVIERMKARASLPAMFWGGAETSYEDFFRLVADWSNRFDAYDIGQGTVVGVLGDYSPRICALFFALMLRRSIIVPFTQACEKEMPEFIAISGVERLFRFGADDGWEIETIPDTEPAALIASFREWNSPGLVVFTSGSTGAPKGILHDCERVMRKFVSERDGWRTVLFLLMDHFGGFNTLLASLAYGGVGVCVKDRTPESVCRAIEASRASLLPTTPSFLNILVASGSWTRFDLSSIELITYGTELMSEATLKKVRSLFPRAAIKQTYGLSELGVLRSKSLESDSTWVKVGGAGFETKVLDNVLWVRSEANMVGYLNAPDPFDAEGWMCTGDEVEVDGDMIRFRGRKAEIINVGGRKVFPVEVESVLMEADNVLDATVYGIRHPLLGEVPCARISLSEAEAPDALSLRLRRHCQDRLARFKVPMRFVVVDAEEQRSERFKKIRIV